MVNMNKLKDPAIYALTRPDGGVFYVGRTSSNAKNRWWQHRSRARSGHQAPLYREMREIGIDGVGWKIIERFCDIPGGVEARDRESYWISHYVDLGNRLVNQYGRDGRPDSWTPERRARGLPSRRGKPSWIKGKTGEEAGWTTARREAQSERMLDRKTILEIKDQNKLFARIQKIEINEMRAIVKSLDRPRHVPTPTRATPNVSHGTRTMWEKYKCKCQPCRDAGARHNARRRGDPDWTSATARSAIPAYKTHGTEASYSKGGCRCEECKVAIRSARAARAARAAGISRVG